MVSARRPTAVEVDLQAFVNNLKVAVKLAGPEAEAMPIVKANGYGHGALPLARAAVEEGIERFGVATVDEGLELREGGVTGEILVLDGIPPGAEEIAMEKGLTAVVFNLDDAGRLHRQASIRRPRGERYPIHVKVDTGMGRLGFDPRKVGEAGRALVKMDSLEVSGVMTHYARADEPGAGPTDRQIALFDEALITLEGAGLKPRWRHAMNSAAILLGRGPRYDLVRPGIMLYGSIPSAFSGCAADYGLKPVMTFHTEIIQLKTVPAGWAISYGGHYVAPGERRVAVLPVGYADGFMRYNSLGGEVLLRGKRVPVLGVVCMDLIIIDVTDVEGAVPGDEVVLIGSQGGETITAGEVAERGKTINYEVYCCLTARVPRRYSQRSGSIEG